MKVALQPLLQLWTFLIVIAVVAPIVWVGLELTIGRRAVHDTPWYAVPFGLLIAGGLWIQRRMLQKLGRRHQGPP